jgi:hypothetical protein
MFQNLRTYLNILCVAGKCRITRRVVRNRLRLRDFWFVFLLLRVLCVNLSGTFCIFFTDDGRVVFDGHFVSASIVARAAENSLRLQSDGEVSGLLEGECSTTFKSL